MPREHIDPEGQELFDKELIPDPEKEHEQEPSLNNAELHAEYLNCVGRDDEKAASKIQWQIALANEKLIWWWARKLWYRWRPPSLTVQDLAHYGMFGVLRAVEKYRPEFETKLSSYAGWWIRRYIDSAIFENGPTIRIPEYRINQKAQIDTVTLELLERGSEPTLERIALELNEREERRCHEKPGRKRTSWTPEDVDTVNCATIQILSSIDKAAYDDGSETLHSYVADERNVLSPEAATAGPFLKEGFRKILETAGISQRDRLILELYFYGKSRDKGTVARLFQIRKKQFGNILGDFLQQFPDLFKLANAQRDDFLSVLRFAHLAEKKRQMLEAYFYQDGKDKAAAARRLGRSDEEFTKVLAAFQKEFAGLHELADSQPESFMSVLRLARQPDERRMMLGVFFCGDDMSKQDIGSLCNVTRERVRQIVESFTENYRGPLSRLFLRDFVSPREICEKFILKRFKVVEAEVDDYFRESGLQKVGAILKLLYVERLPHKEISERCGGIQPGSISNRLKRVAHKLSAVPVKLMPFFCGGHTSFSPKEILARQVWEFLAEAEREAFKKTISEDETIIFDARLALHGEQITLKNLIGRLGKKNVGDVSCAFEQILQNYFDFAAEHLKKRS